MQELPFLVNCFMKFMVIIVNSVGGRGCGCSVPTPFKYVMSKVCGAASLEKAVMYEGAMMVLAKQQLWFVYCAFGIKMVVNSWKDGGGLKLIYGYNK